MIFTQRRETGLGLAQGSIRGNGEATAAAVRGGMSASALVAQHRSVVAQHKNRLSQLEAEKHELQKRVEELEGGSGLRRGSDGHITTRGRR